MSPDPLRASLVRYTLCNLNRIGAYLRPCLTALSLFTLLVSPWSNRTFNTEERLHHVNSEYYKPSLKSRIRGTAVSSVIMLRVGQSTSRGWRCGNDNRCFYFQMYQHRLWGQPSLFFNRHRELLYPDVKRTGREDDHAPSPTAKVKYKWGWNSTALTPSWRAQRQLFIRLRNKWI